MHTLHTVYVHVYILYVITVLRENLFNSNVRYSMFTKVILEYLMWSTVTKKYYLHCYLIICYFNIILCGLYSVCRKLSVLWKEPMWQLKYTIWET